MKRTLLCLLALLVLLVGLTACKATPASTGEETTPAETTLPETTAPPAPDIVLVSNGTAAYNVVRREMTSDLAIQAAVGVRTAIGEATGTFPDLVTDWVPHGADHDHTTKEILVGPTDYSESARALEGIAYGEYIITQIDNKLVINAWTDQSLNAALETFTALITPLAENGSLTLPGDIHIVDTAIPVVNALPLYEGGTFDSIYHAGDNNQLVLIKKTNLDEYSAYRNLLAESGFTLYTSNNIVNNAFATYINDDYVINVGYYAYESATRIIVEPRTTLAHQVNNEQYTKIMEPTLAMLGLEHGSNIDDYQNGMSFVFQLSDGSYIIIDGGFNRNRDSKALYEYLYTYAPDPNQITIAAWIITHAHGDHNGCFFNFVENYASKVTVEMVVGNFPSEEARHLLGTEGSGAPKILSYTKDLLKTDFLKIHVGNKLYLRDAEIEFLYTLESYAPQELTYFNTSSLVFTVKIAGQTLFFPGDASNAALSITSKMYGNYLKSDILQTAHHGYGGGSSSYTGITNAYDLVSPEIVLWPVGAQTYPGMSNRAYDSHLQNLPSVKEIIVAGSRDVRLTLPYVMGTSGVETIIK